jgi:type II secretory pathway pseudopilin PulG
MCASKKKKGNAGFLLIELLAAAVILSTALVVISRTFSNSALLLRRTSSQLRAAMLLEEKMAEFEQTAVLTTGSHEGTFSHSAPFRWSAEVEKRTEPLLVQVALTDSWQEGARPQSLTVTTLLEKLPQTP